MTRVLCEVRRFVSSQPVCRGAGVVAVSGGADSVALLRALCQAGVGPLTVAHLNHRSRGAESDADEAFVRDLAASLGLDFRARSVDVAARGGNFEEAARRVRYEFFAEVAAGVGAAWVATGHTADDQAETVLHRLVRGTGLQGLRGIAAVQERPDGATGAAVVRPLLSVTRADVLDHLATLNQPYRQDATNADPHFTRNRIRHELLPLLRTFNPEVVTALVRLAGHAAEAHEVITAHAAAVLAEAERPRVGPTVILDAPRLGTSPAVARAVLRLVWQRERWPLADMGADAWDRAAAVALGSNPACDFPGGITMRHTGRVVQIGPGK